MVEFSYRIVRGRAAIATLAGGLAAIALVPSHAEADAPPCRYRTSADTVVDNDTGLTWQRTVDAASYTHSDAISYCANLPLDGGGWRLPSIQELQTIVDDSTYSPAIDSAAFSNTPGTYFWSSSVYAGNPNGAWIVDFHLGYVANVVVASTRRVRCVR